MVDYKEIIEAIQNTLLAGKLQEKLAKEWEKKRKKVPKSDYIDPELDI